MITYFLAFMPTTFPRRLLRLCLLCLPVVLLFSSCASTRYYNQRTMFRLTDSEGNRLDTTKLRTAVNRAARNYVIQPNDYLEVRVYTNKGERILDPNGELRFGSPAGAIGPSARGAAGASSVQTAGAANAQGTNSAFLVQADGTVMLPMVNRIKVSGLSLLQADSTLKIAYNEYYREPFVTTRVVNNRVVVLGAPGGKVVPLTNDNMNLLEVLALAGGTDGGSTGGNGLYRFGGRLSNIRIIRGDLKNPQVQEIDLTTLEGMRKGNLQMEPNDIVYIEPIRRPLLDGLADAGPVLSAAALLLNASTIFITIFLR
ncbi:polysaccharide biosynthesis/export family protein [Hymenobacter saemangeumensis]|uniref:polysaccharide biosynthesis/export family protein n=1 Tax=Hymenobacter saemangeumensis TaxID=1084522 RepID=UPI0031EC4026